MKTKVRFVVLAIAAFAISGIANADGVAWADLSRDQRELLSEHADNWAQMDETRQEQIATGAARWLEMNTRQQSQAENRDRKSVV